METSAGSRIASIGDAVPSKELVEAGNIIGNFEPRMNGAATLLVTVTTALNGVDTTVPVVTIMVNDASPLLPVVNDDMGLSTGLNSGGSGSGVGIVKGRRRAAKRVENMPPEEVNFLREESE